MHGSHNPIRADARCYTRHRNREDWKTFEPDHAAGRADSAFAIVDEIVERYWGPQAATRTICPPSPVEVITYVRSGRLLVADSQDEDRILCAGEFEREIIAPGRPCSPCRQANPSDTHYAHVFQISLRLDQPDLEPARRREHFSEAHRKGRVLLVASPDGVGESLRLESDVRIFSTLLYPGRHVVHEVPPQRAVWVHVVHGALSLGDGVLHKGDGVGVTTGTVSLTAREHSEILLIDVGLTASPTADA